MSAEPGDALDQGNDEKSLLTLAAQRAAAGDHAGSEFAINKVLEARPNSISGHLGKADCRMRAGDMDLATYFYRKAIRLAAHAPDTDVLSADLQRARLALGEIEARTHAEREARLTQRALPPDRWSPRLRQSLEIAAGRKQAYVQEPTAFAYSGLPQIQFYDPGRFHWAPAVEARTDVIREELLALMAGDVDGFRPYIQSHVGAIPGQANRALLDKRDWSVSALCEQGWLVADTVRRCPRTWEAVLQAPVPRISGWGPTVVFSMLKAGSHIAPHSGMFNTRLICHLPLIVPPGCRFRVGNEVREWEEGKLMIFDDSIEHEAWNDGPDDRVVLIFDIWRPELTEQERHELTALFSD